MSASAFGIVPVDPRAGLDPSFVPPSGAVCLSEDARTYLADGIVYRPRTPWTGSVHALLSHLEEVGYRGSPRLVDSGIDDEGRQQLHYVEGGRVHPRPVAGRRRQVRGARWILNNADVLQRALDVLPG